MPASKRRRPPPELDQADLNRALGYMRETREARGWLERLMALGGAGLVAEVVPAPVRAQLAGRRLVQRRPDQPERLILSRAGLAVGHLIQAR